MREDLTKILSLHESFWKGENIGRPLYAYEKEFEVNLSEMKLADGSYVKDGIVLKPEMLSPEALHPLQADSDETQPMPYTKGDLFRTVSPYWKIPWMEAIVGCPPRVRITSNSIWAETQPDFSLENVRSPSDLIDEQWLKKLLEITKYLVDKFNGPYFVTQTIPTRGPIDILDAIIGTDRMIVEMYTHPRQTSEILEILGEVFIMVVKDQLELIPRFKGGYVNPFGFWAPGTSIRSQEHACAALSPKLYSKFVLPCEEKITSEFDYTTYHTHTGLLHLEDKIAELDTLNAIHVSVDPVPFDQPLPALLPKLAKLQEEKPIIIEGELTKADVDAAVERLPPKGLCIVSTSE